MQKLCEAICMPEPVTRQILALEAGETCPDIRGLTREEEWDTALACVREALGPDPDGIRMLWCMLRCARDAWEKYEALGLSRQIYVDTMGCFSRFVREHMESYGCYGFDRAFWTVRQVSCKLFRIGELEYELIMKDGKPAVSLHIPTDVRLEPERLRRSWEQAVEILTRTFPAYGNGPMVCHSWLLSPDLDGLLPMNSRIRLFQQSFGITALDMPCQGVMQWVFKNPKLQPEDYPEETSLQRKLKNFLLAGNCFRDARGVLKADPFLTEQDR